MVSSSSRPREHGVDADAGDTLPAEGAAPPTEADAAPPAAPGGPHDDPEPTAVMRRFRRGRWTLMPSSR